MSNQMQNTQAMFCKRCGDLSNQGKEVCDNCEAKSGITGSCKTCRVYLALPGKDVCKGCYGKSTVGASSCSYCGGSPLNNPPGTNSTLCASCLKDKDQYGACISCRNNPVSGNSSKCSHCLNPIMVPTGGNNPPRSSIAAPFSPQGNANPPWRSLGASGPPNTGNPNPGYHTPPSNPIPPMSHTPTPFGQTTWERDVPATRNPSVSTPNPNPTPITPAKPTTGQSTPGAHTPGTHTPGAHTPGGHTPGTHTPGTHTPGSHKTPIMCEFCHQKPAQSGQTACEECWGTWQHRVKQSTVTGDNHKCINCRLNIANPGSDRCGSCSTKQTLCTECNAKPPNPGFPLCNDCFLKTRPPGNNGNNGNSSNTTTVLCTKCNSKPPNPGFPLCNDCFLLQRNGNTSNNNNGNSSTGVLMCTSCGVNPPNPGYRTCVPCYKGKTSQQNSPHIGAKTCANCSNPPDRGFKFCKACFQETKKFAVPGGSVYQELPAVEKVIARIINDHRTKGGLAALDHDLMLSTKARFHSYQMASGAAKFEVIGKNCNISKRKDIQSAAEKTVKKWFKTNAVELANINANHYTCSGVGVILNSRTGVVYITQIFK